MEACAPSMTLESGLASASVVGVDQAVQVGAALAALTAAEVLQLFESCGAVEKVLLVRDRAGHPKGFVRAVD